MLGNHKDKNSKESFPWEEMITTIGILALLASVVLLTHYRTPSGLSVTGTMFWNGEPAETVSVIFCPSGTLSGLSIPLFRIEGGCDEKSAPWTIIDSSGEYHFSNIPPGKYTIFYKWPGEDEWNLGETVKESTLIFVEEKGVTKVDPMFAVPNDWLIEPKEISNYPRIIPASDQRTIFGWKALKDADHYFIGIFDESGEEHPGQTIFSETVTNPVVEVLLPKGKLSLGIRAYNSREELIGKGWYFFEAK